jgi:hypothetical protein
MYPFSESYLRGHSSTGRALTKKKIWNPGNKYNSMEEPRGSKKNNGE